MRKTSLLRTICFSCVKIAIAAGLLVLLFGKIDSDQLFSFISRLDTSTVIWALLWMTLANIASAFRMRIYVCSAKRFMSYRFSLVLYFVGAVLNFVLPGGVTGDLYKAYHLKKHREMPLQLTIYRMISDRLSGIYALCLLALGCLLIIDLNSWYGSVGFLLLAACGGSIAYLGIGNYILREFPPLQFYTLPYSLAVQIGWAMAFLHILYGLGIPSDSPAYLLMFLISSLISIIPISIGGLGLREYGFYYGTLLLAAEGVTGLDAELGISAALIFFVLHLISSLPGIVYFWRLKAETDRENRLYEVLI